MIGCCVGGSALNEVGLSAVPCFGAAIGVIAIGVAGLNVGGRNRWSVENTM
jgi:predicted MFS family arabinose efflux permease